MQKLKWTRVFPCKRSWSYSFQKNHFALGSEHRDASGGYLCALLELKLLKIIRNTLWEVKKSVVFPMKENWQSSKQYQ